MPIGWNRSLEVYTQHLSRFGGALLFPVLVVGPRKDMEDDVLGLEVSPPFVAIPWKLSTKVLRFHLFKSWDELLHHHIRQVREDLLHFECHGYLCIQSSLVDQRVIRNQGLHHCKFSPLVGVEELEPLKQSFTISSGDHWASILNRDLDLPSFIISKLTLTFLHWSSKSKSVKRPIGMIVDRLGEEGFDNKILVPFFKRNISVTPSAS